MAGTEKIVGSLQQSSSAMSSSAILSFNSIHPSYEFGRSHRKIPSLQASMTGKEDCSATMHKPHKESSSRSSSVSSLLKAVQENGSGAVLQQVSSIRHFFTPELPQAIITEIKKRMALSFKDQDDEEENAIQDDLNGGLLGEGPEEQVNLLGPRCAWPRLKLASAEEERRGGATQGPRCAWPRVAQTQSSSSSVQQNEKRGTSRNYYQNNNTERLQKGLISSSSGNSKSPQEGLVNSMSSLEGLQKGALSQESLEKEALSKSVQEGEMGPRCAWPRSTPRRMLATGVGLSLVNYLFIGQGAPALALLLDTIICEEEEPSFSTSPLKSLLP